MSDASTGQTIEIRTIADFLALPPARRVVAIREFGEWCDIIDLHAAVAPELAKAGISLTAAADVFRWVDDDKGERHINLTVKAVPK